MKKILLLGAMSLFCLNANAQTNSNNLKTYVSGKAKYVMMDSDVTYRDFYGTTMDEDVVGASIALGMSLNNRDTGLFRFEAEYNKNDVSTKQYSNSIDLELDTQAVMFNTYYHLPTGSALTPYIGFGFGAAHVKGKASRIGEIKKTNFAWQMGTGISYDLTENFALDLGYRYMDYGDFEKYGYNIDTRTHEFYTGIRISF